MNVLIICAQTQLSECLILKFRNTSSMTYYVFNYHEPQHMGNRWYV